MVKPDWVKPGATILDVGVNFVPDKKKKSGQRMCGDVDYAACSEVAGYITPVPGGIGPMTVAMLMRNTLTNAQRRVERRLRGGCAPRRGGRRSDRSRAAACKTGGYKMVSSAL